MTHLADREYRRDSKIFSLPTGHQWVCNASLPSWPKVLEMWHRLDLSYMFLCKQCVTKFGFRESLMQSVEVEIDRATTFGQQLEDLVVQKGSVTIGQDQDRDRLLLAHWALAFDLDKSILALMRLKFYGGAFALLRPLIEAQIRAHIVLMGSSNDVSQIKDDKYNVNFSTIGAEIDKNFALHTTEDHGERPQGPRRKSMSRRPGLQGRRRSTPRPPLLTRESS